MPCDRFRHRRVDPSDPDLSGCRTLDRRREYASNLREMLASDAAGLVGQDESGIDVTFRHQGVESSDAVEFELDRGRGSDLGERGRVSLWILAARLTLHAFTVPEGCCTVGEAGSGNGPLG